MREIVVAAFAIGALGLAAACSWRGIAQAADFYAGKTINFIVGADAAGGYDVYARAIARHLSRFIPGSPTIVVHNMPGAGSGKAAAYLYTLAPKDGTTIAALFPGVIIDPLLQKHAAGPVRCDEVHLSGERRQRSRLCVTGPSSKVKTFDQAMTEKTVIGATQTGGSTSDYAYMNKNATGVKFDIVSGYKGTANIMLAIERGEIEGMCGIDWSSLKAERSQWLRDKTVHLLVQAATEPDPELAARNVPTVGSFIKDDLDKQGVVSGHRQQVFSRPYVAPPACRRSRQRFCGRRLPTRCMIRSCWPKPRPRA